MIPETLKALAVNIDTLKPYPSNARRGDLEMIKESLRLNGQYRPVVVNRLTMEVLAGNHTLEAAALLGEKQIAATFIEATPEEAKRIVLIDNRANDVATYDDELLVELLQDLEGDLAGTGFAQDDLDALLADLSGGWSVDRKDRVPDLPADITTKLGDVIELGPNAVLVCGDALDPDVRALVLDQAADLVVTDPPYMVDYQGGLSPEEAATLNRRTDGAEVTNDQLTGQAADEFIAAAMGALHVELKPGGVFYVFSPPGLDELRFRHGLQIAGLELREVIVWVKDRFAFGRQDYHWRHETIMYGWRAGAAHFFIDDRTQDTVWEYPRPGASKEHPTMKPVALLERAIANSSRKGELIFDPFAGSGSTLVAALAQGRRCALIELHPGYCDVIVTRWEELTGEKATRPA